MNDEFMDKAYNRLEEHSTCCTVYFNSITFHDSKITFDLDIMHNMFKSTRIKNLVINFPVNIITLFDKNFSNNLSAMLQLGTIEEGKTLEVKFMDSDIRKNNEKFLDVFTSKFNIVGDNTIILRLTNRQQQHDLDRLV